MNYIEALNYKKRSAEEYKDILMRNYMDNRLQIKDIDGAIRDCEDFIDEVYQLKATA